MTKLNWEKATSQEKARPPRKGKRPIAWYWTPARMNGVCHQCAESIAKGERIAYMHVEQTVLCEVCADAQGIVPHDSRAMRATREGRRRAKTRPRKRPCSECGRVWTTRGICRPCKRRRKAKPVEVTQEDIDRFAAAMSQKWRPTGA